MKTLIFFIVSLALAIPTFGVSLVIYFIIMHKINSFVANRVLINRAITSEKRGSTEDVYQVTGAAISIFFRRWGTGAYDTFGKEKIGLVNNPATHKPMRVSFTKDGKVTNIKAYEV